MTKAKFNGAVRMSTHTDNPPIRFLECVKIWWRFFLSFIAVLLFCSLTTHILLLGAVWLTNALNFGQSAPKTLVEINHFGPVNGTLLHFVGLTSLGCFTIGQICTFYLLLNRSNVIRTILYKNTKTNPYTSPLSTPTETEHQALPHDSIKKI